MKKTRTGSKRNSLAKTGQLRKRDSSRTSIKRAARAQRVLPVTKGSHTKGSHKGKGETGVTETNQKIYTALNSLMAACDLVGESGTEILFGVLSEAVARVDEQWLIVENNQKNGLCYDVNALLADQMEAALARDTQEEGPVQSYDDDDDDDAIDDGSLPLWRVYYNIRD